MATPEDLLYLGHLILQLHRTRKLTLWEVETVMTRDRPTSGGHVPAGGSLRAVKQAHVGLVSAKLLVLSSSDTPGTYGITKAGEVHLAFDDSIFAAFHV